MIYKPENGCMWDPSVLYHDGYYYMVSMYKQDADKKITLCGWPSLKTAFTGKASARY